MVHAIVLIEDALGWTSRENLYTLQRTGQPLGVECTACGHRGLVPFGRAKRRRSDMTPIKNLPLACVCGSKKWTAVLFSKRDSPEAWQGQTSPLFG